MILYRLLVILVLPWALIRLWWQTRTLPRYRRRWRERLGGGAPVASGAIWIHAVSVGETRAVAPLIRDLLYSCPQYPLLVTTTTLTGADQVNALFGNRVTHRFAPFDCGPFVRRFLARSRPRLVVVLETELWPTLFLQLERNGIPLMLANVRLSDRSYRGYRWVRWLMAPTLAVPAVIAVQSAADGTRLQVLGAPKARIHVTGNLKFEVPIDAALIARGRDLRQQWGHQRPVWVAASTHAGEEAAALAAHRLICQHQPHTLLVLVPRHPQRFTAVAQLCDQQRIAFVRRSSGQPVLATQTVLLGDTMGELLMFYAAADCAFIGGSLVPAGGHNPLEALALGIPAIFGPHMFNFAEIAAWVLDAHAGCQVASAGALADAVHDYLVDPAKRVAAGTHGRALIATHAGATARTRALILTLLPADPGPSARSPETADAPRRAATQTPPIR